jgi:hypothetical protein
MVILSLVYDIIPNSVPAFVDIWGNSVISMEKSYIAILRLPFMGLLLSLLCLIMYSLKIYGKNDKFNKIIWSIVALICALKMGIQSMEILFYENIETINIFRTILFILIIIGIIILVYSVLKMNKNKIPYSEYKIEIKNNRIKIIGIICVYIIIVLMPFYIK